MLKRSIREYAGSQLSLLGLRTILVWLLTISLVSAPGSALSVPADGDGSLANEGDMNATAPPDPDEDVIGWENGYWYNESIDVDQSDGLSDAEVKAFKSRTMARVEVLRGLEFTDDVEIEFVSTEGINQYVDQNVTQLPGNDQTWEALFVFGEKTDSEQAVYDSLTASVAGMAAEEGVDHTVLPVEDPDEPTMGSTILAHELAYMLQHQHYDLSQDKYHHQRLNDEMAKDGIVEGEAAYIDALYRERCAQGEWSCVPRSQHTSGDASRPDPAFSALMSFPYSDGEVYVRDLVTEHGWAKIDAMHADLPESVEPIIHREKRNESPANLSFEDTSRNGWQMAANETTSIGEAGIFILFWNQATRHDIPVIDPSTFRTGDQSDPRNFTSQPSAGWGNDTLYTYRNGSESGYVWVTTWDTERDAREFAAAYRQVLSGRDASQRDDQIWVMSDSDFADAFYVDRSGTRVMIVNGPTTGDLQAIRPEIQLDRSNQEQADGDSAASATDGTVGWPHVITLLISSLALIVYLVSRRRT